MEAMTLPGTLIHRGMSYRRTKHNPREKAFADAWEEENRPITGVNHGHGILQDLFFDGHGVGAAVHLWVTPREAMIVAEIVQWFGSNCGMNFLDKALGHCGYEISAIPTGRVPARTKITKRTLRV